jgi:arsenate reductase (glutaredoxin)
MKIYYNPKCNKCRIAKDYLENHDIKFKTFEYLSNFFTKQDIKAILKKGNLSIQEILRKNEPEYQEYIKEKNLSEDQILGVLIQHPKILQRPIIITEDKAIIARDEESLNKLKSL